MISAIGGSLAALVFRNQAEKLGGQAEDLRNEQALATRRLFDTLLARAQSGRWSGRMGQRFESLRALTEAAGLGPSLNWQEEQKLLLRNEAIACLILPDLRLAQPAHRLPPGTFILAYDGPLERYVGSDQNGNLHLCRTADDAELARLPGAGDRAYVGQFSADGRLLAVKYEGTRRQVAKVWDIAAKQVVLESAGVEFDFSPDDNWFALVTPDGSIQLFDPHSHRAVKRIPVEPASEVVRFDPHGRLLAVCNRRSADVRIIDIESAMVVKTFHHPREVYFLNWNSTGNLLACACLDHRAYVWDVRSGEKQAVLDGYQAEVVGVVFSHSGPILASYSWDKTTRLWDYRTGRQLMSAGGEVLAFSADDRRLAFRDQSGWVADNVRVFDFASGDECRTLQEVGAREKGPNHLDISPDNRLLLSCGPDGARLWDTATAKQLAVLYEVNQMQGANSTVMFHPDGTSVLTSMKDGVYRWPIQRFREEGRPHVKIGPPQQVSDLRGDGSACLDRTGRNLAMIRGEEAYVIALDQASQPVRLSGHAGMTRIAISPDGQWVATGTWHGLGVVLRDAKTGRKVRDLFPEATSATVAFSPDGKWLVSGANDIYRFWQVGTWDHRDIPGTFPYLIAFSDDGETIALSNSPSAVRLVNPNTGHTFAELEAQNPQIMSWLRFAPDGSRLAVACGTHVIQLWDLRRIRQQLSTIGLDWNAPAYPTDGVDARVPIQVEVNQGILAPSHGGS